MKEPKSIFSRLFGKEDAGGSGDGENLASPLSGTVIPLEQVEDQTFAGKILGDGIAVLPAEGKLYSPVDGEISTLMDTLHALCITSAYGAELLIHVGQDTVTLGGKHFTCHVKEGQKVKRGQLLLEFDTEAIRAAGLSLTTPVIVSNWDEYDMTKTTQEAVSHGDTLLTLRRKA